MYGKFIEKYTLLRTIIFVLVTVDREQFFAPLKVSNHLSLCQLITNTPKTRLANLNHSLKRAAKSCLIYSFPLSV